ncbi:MAG: histidine phosphatase family protein [Siculibacillus sp.]|nr:histidine phosphatase family protein [Siculibacillus sp.]
MSRTIFHIRHGLTDWNVVGRLQGAQDIPLNGVGRAQAGANGLALARHLAAIDRDPASFRWVASPLWRARETMERVRRAVGLPAICHDLERDLREVGYGRFEGMTHAEIEKADPAAMDGLRNDKWHYRPPGGESYVMLCERVARWWATTDGDMVIVSHGGTFRALRLAIENNRDPALAVYQVPQDRIFRWQDARGAWL